MKSKTPAWLRRRGYRHFDDAKRGTDPATQRFDPADVAKHAFLPFIAKTQKTPRYKPELRRVEPKDRPLRYAAHKDARIYSRYAWLLSHEYERKLQEQSFADCVVAYRSRSEKRSNIETAKECFDFIEAFGECDVVTADVTGFFDALDHEQLKALWCELLEVDRLPPDHFAVFKQLTQYRYVELDAFLQEAKISRSSLSRHSAPGHTGQRFADMKEIRQILKAEGLVRKNQEHHGIPQGSPMSAVLSNIYMLHVDKRLAEYAEEVDGFYRRYSDDLMIVVPPGEKERAKQQLEEALSLAKLVSNEGKASEHLFRIDPEGLLVCRSPIEYLGFEFDGTRVLIKRKTLSRFYQRAARLIRQMRSAARANGATELNRKRIFDRCTHLGKRNFVTYAKRAAKVFYPEQPQSSPIMRQLRRHTKIIQSRIDEANEWLAQNA